VGDAQYRQARGNEAAPAIEGGTVMKRLAICYREAARPIRRRQAAYKKLPEDRASLKEQLRGTETTFGSDL
jgi:hypothetical protein